jgi:hypothetical protein
MFKKRTISKTHLRQSLDVSADSEGASAGEKISSVEGESPDTAISLDIIRAEQLMRKKHNGLVVDAKQDFQRIKKSQSSTVAPKTITTMITSQFSSTNGDSNSTVAHEKIMEAYIEARLGTNKAE